MTHDALDRWRGRAAGAPGAVDALIALGLFAVLSLGVTTQAELAHEHGRLIGALLNALIAAPLAVRRRWPLAALALSAGAAALVSLTFGVTGGEGAALVALGTVASRERRPALAALAVAAAAAGALAVAIAIGDDTPSEFAASVAAVAAAAAFGVAARARRSQLRAIADGAARDATLAVAAERARIALELHDVVAHNVSVMVALADGAQHAPERSHEAMGHVAATGRETLRELRGLLGVLRDGGDDAARIPQPGLEQLDDLIARVREAGLPARLRVEGPPAALSPVAQITLYRIVQEALTNVLRHAVEPSGVDVGLRWGADGVTLEIVDDGGAPPGRDAAPSGRGLAGMRERAALHGATLLAGPRADGGWRVVTRIPLGAA